MEFWLVLLPVSLMHEHVQSSDTNLKSSDKQLLASGLRDRPRGKQLQRRTWTGWWSWLVLLWEFHLQRHHFYSFLIFCLIDLSFSFFFFWCSTSHCLHRPSLSRRPLASCLLSWKHSLTHSSFSLFTVDHEPGGTFASCICVFCDFCWAMNFVLTLPWLLQMTFKIDHCVITSIWVAIPTHTSRAVSVLHNSRCWKKPSVFACLSKFWRKITSAAWWSSPRASTSKIRAKSTIVWKEKNRPF